jgi:hypothetical protein
MTAALGEHLAVCAAPMVVTDNTSLVAQEPSAFEMAVRERSWDWLLELRRRLKVDLQLVDKRYAPLLPFTAAGATASVTGLLEPGDSPLRPLRTRFNCVNHSRMRFTASKSSASR